MSLGNVQVSDAGEVPRGRKSSWRATKKGRAADEASRGWIESVSVEISSQGGKAAHQKGTAHEFDSEEAREAGRKGGMVSGGRRRAREAGTPNPVVNTERESESDNERESESLTGGEGSHAPAGHGA